MFKSIFFSGLFTLAFLPGLMGQYSDVAFPNGKLSETGGVLMFNVSDSLVGVFYLRYEGNAFKEVIRLYNKRDLSLAQHFTQQYAPFDATYALGAYKDSTNAVCLYTNRFRDGVNNVRICRYASGQLDTAFARFSFPGIVAGGFKHIGGELFFISRNTTPSDTSSGWIDSVHIQVRDVSGKLKRHRWYVSHRQGSEAGALNYATVLTPKLHPVNGNLIFIEFIACNYTEISPQSLDVVHVNRETSTRTTIAPLLISNFEVSAEGIECGGQGVFLQRDSFGTNYDLQFYYATKSWGPDTAKPYMFGPAKISNRGYAFSIEKSSGTRLLAGSIPFDRYAFNATEPREILIYRFNDHGQDSILLYGAKNHVPIQLYPDSNGDLFILSTYTEAWTTDSTYYMLTKIPGFAISLIENHSTEAEIQLYPNPAHNYLRIDQLKEEALQLAFYTQAGQLVKEVEVERKEIDISSLKAGLYVVVLTNAQGQHSQLLLQVE